MVPRVSEHEDAFAEQTLAAGVHLVQLVPNANRSAGRSSSNGRAQKPSCSAQARELRERSSSWAPRASIAEASAWRLWRQPLLSKISSTRGPAWGGLRVDDPRGPKRSRGANCLYQEVPSFRAGLVRVHREVSPDPRRRVPVAWACGRDIASHAAKRCRQHEELDDVFRRQPLRARRFARPADRRLQQTMA